MDNAASPKGSSPQEILIAPCGLVCSHCDAYRAAQKNSPEMLEQVAADWRKIYASDDIKAEHIACDGCMSASHRKCAFCSTMCEIRPCAVEKKVSVCSQCPEYPCGKLNKFLNMAPQGQAAAMRRLLDSVTDVEKNMHSIF